MISETFRNNLSMLYIQREETVIFQYNKAGFNYIPHMNVKCWWQFEESSSNVYTVSKKS